jgi:hypothetical protein
MGKRIGVSEFLENVSKFKKKEEKVKVLQENDHFAIKTILQGAFDPRITWLLPEGDPPYKPSDLVDQENVLIHDVRKLVHFIEGGNPNLKQNKRESMFVEMLETIAPADAKLLCAIKEKKLPWKGITPEIVREAYPGLIGDEQV